MRSGSGTPSGEGGEHFQSPGTQHTAARCLQHRSPALANAGSEQWDSAGPTPQAELRGQQRLAVWGAGRTGALWVQEQCLDLICWL